MIWYKKFDRLLPMRTSRLLLCITLPALGACSVQQRIESVEQDIHRQFADAQSWEQLPLRVISWEQAVSMMLRGNHSLKELDSRIEDAERNSISIYTDMIPGVSYYGYFTRSINQLSSEVSAKDLSSEINVTFSLPSLSQVPYRVYASQAEIYSILKAKEGKERECISQLYNAVHSRALDLKIREYDATSPDISEQDKILAKRAYLNADAEHWNTMAKLLGDYSARWQILPSSAPRIDWSIYEARMSKPDDLVVCMYALRLEQARLTQYRVALNYLPTINMSLYSPTLFSSSGGTYQGSFLSGEDTRLNMSLSYSLDTKLSNWNSYKRGKQQYEKVQREVAAGIIEHKNKLATLKSSVQEYRHWRSYMNKRIEYLHAQPVTSAEELITRDRTILDMEKELLIQEKSVLESESAVVLEYGLIR